ncbi:High-affinity choline transporter 1, partial [Tetrabaena socialis]
MTVEEVEASSFGCCQKFVCALPCPAQFNDDGVAVHFGIPVAVVSLVWFIMALVIARLTIKGDAKAFFVCNRSLPLYVVTCALLAQGLDSNATLGNVINAYNGECTIKTGNSQTCCSVADGAVLPLGLGISLVLNGLLLAAPINRMGLLTLPELYGRKYGGLMEVIVSLIEICSFTFLLAGNLVGISLVLQFCFGLPKGAGIAIAGGVLALYSGSGGLFSVALTDLPQVVGGFTAFTATTIYMLTREPDTQAAPVSLGFALDLGGNVTARTPGYTGPVDCVDPVTGAGTCDNFAYPVGDHLVWPKSMADPDAYAPFPNAILLNWATIFVLGFGNLCALDFQARCMAAKGPNVARIANFIAGAVLVCLGVPFGLLAGLARKHYGPDSVYANFEADTCSLPLGLPSCAEWVPDGKDALFKLLWEHGPKALGAWTLVAIVTASMSTADGAILATSTVMAHNIWRKTWRAVQPLYQLDLPDVDPDSSRTEPGLDKAMSVEPLDLPTPARPNSAVSPVADDPVGKAV